ncbi:putative hydrolase protein [Acetobacter senegalensis]|uniref:Putative hydrolase protein n=2 Tax=Acetobacter senegalensis TaxID=446692 RepID=A0A0U5EVS1_9PROT|nr:HAD family phosphatase [Acetobacter senegalensis]CEF40976.1 putative hydrolase protein [Acetobacter senegalensis]
MMASPLALSADGSLKLVIFDCDGVLVDSEETCCRISAQEARAAGMDVPDDLAVDTFSGMALPSIQDVIEQKTRKSLGADWAARTQARFVAAMKQGVEPIDGVYAMLEDVTKLGLPVRVGSNSSVEEMDAKFIATNLTPYFEGRIHSARDMGIPKPRPDVYLHAAKEEQVAPANCVVLEDSNTGARAAIDAGMMCVLLRKAGEDVPDWPNLVVIHHLCEFAPLLKEALKAQGRLA